jgi:predicted transcriptional regulator YdeE
MSADGDPSIVHIEGFRVVGISGRTSNAAETSGKKAVIGPLWHRFLEEDVLGQIANKADSKVVGVYTDYESDSHDAYTVICGAKVKAPGKPAAGLVSAEIPSGDYAVYTSERGPLWEVVPAVWMRIWKSLEQETGRQRAFQADFEIYDERATDRTNAVCDVYVGLK